MSPSERPPQLTDRLVYWLAVGLGAGLSPIGAGTIGTLWGIPLTLAIHMVPSLWIQGAVIVGLNLLGIVLCGMAAKQLNTKDPQCVVWDELATLPMTFFLIPTAMLWNPWVLLIGFLLHRVFDISKLWPLHVLERLPGGWGIMADDWAAGVYSCAVLHAILWIVGVSRLIEGSLYRDGKNFGWKEDGGGNPRRDPPRR